jgi:AcrR family transcriptional regulator
MPSVQGVRERARAEITAEILAAARRQLATAGAAGLSLRAVAREVGMVSSAVYRYVASRDELLTLLIVESYDALGAVVEAAAAPRRGRAPAERFVAAARAVRGWAVANPHEYALLYGSPVPGYEAPQDTIGPASRTTLALVGIVADAHRDGHLDASARLAVAVPSPLRPDLAAIREAAGVDLPDDVVVAMVAAWTQLFGLVSFELFGQTRNVVHQHGALFDATVLAMARGVGLPSGRAT